MELNNLFSSPIDVIVEAQWTDITFEEAKNGGEDEIIRPEYKGKVVGVVNMHAARIPYLIVIDEEGGFNICEKHTVKAVDYESI